MASGLVMRMLLWCVCSAPCILVSQHLCMPLLARVFVFVYQCVPLRACVCKCVYVYVVLLAWRAMPQGAWAASEGPVCPQSLTICALLVVIKVSNLEVVWGLAKRGHKMSLCFSSRWATVTIFTYLYTLIVFPLLLWHWGSQSLVWERRRQGLGGYRSKEEHSRSQIKFGSTVFSAMNKLIAEKTMKIMQKKTPTKLKDAGCLQTKAWLFVCRAWNNLLIPEGKLFCTAVKNATNLQSQLQSHYNQPKQSSSHSSSVL